MTPHTPSLKKAKEQGEMPLPHSILKMIYAECGIEMKASTTSLCFGNNSPSGNIKKSLVN